MCEDQTNGVHGVQECCCCKRGEHLKLLSVFNNKGGVGKTTLTFHLGHAISELGYKVLLIDADPQCNLTIFALDEEVIHDIWKAEDDAIDNGIEEVRKRLSADDFQSLIAKSRSIHFHTKACEDGTGELTSTPPPTKLTNALDLIPGRLSFHMFEEKIASRWGDAYRGDPLAIRTITRIHSLANEMAQKNGYDYVIVDTSPSLGFLNKVIISMVDGFFVPALPDLFSVYGIRNIGKALSAWRKDFDVMYKLISDDKRRLFPSNFVSFLGFVIYNAKRYQGSDPRGLAKAHQKFADEIPDTINRYISQDLIPVSVVGVVSQPIGGTAIIHTHNTFPAVAQTYHVPMWKVPDQSDLLPEHKSTVPGQSANYRDTKLSYQTFAKDLLQRIGTP